MNSNAGVNGMRKMVTQVNEEGPIGSPAACFDRSGRDFRLDSTLPKVSSRNVWRLSWSVVRASSVSMLAISASSSSPGVPIAV